MADNFGVRNEGKYMLVFCAPDVCKMPNGTPVPFPITQKLSSAQKIAKKTKFNGHWVVMLKSNTPSVLGDQAGVAKGLKSGTVAKKGEPIDHTKSFNVEGSPVIRVGDKVNMNNKNTKGKVVFAPAPSASAIVDTGASD